MLSRRSSVLSVLLGISALTFLGAAALAAVTEGAPPVRHLLVGLGAGTSSGVGLLLLYNALAIGPMSVVAPVSATAVTIPVAVGLLGGDRLVGAQPAGMALAICGVVLVSAGGAEERSSGNVRLALTLAVAASATIGLNMIALRSTAQAGALWGLAAIRLGATTFLSCVALLWPTAFRRPVRALWLPIAGAATVSGVALCLLLEANRHGSLSVVATLVSLYPVSTVVLATLVLRERLRPLQALGIASALAGVAVMSAA